MDAQLYTQIEDMLQVMASGVFLAGLKVFMVVIKTKARTIYELESYRRYYATTHKRM